MLTETEPTCGDCSGFCDEALKHKLNAEAKRVKAKVCVEEGVIETSEICTKFRPNVNPLRDVIALDGMYTLIQSMSKMNSRQLNSMSALLRHTARTKREGFNFGECVYVQYRGLERSMYVSNFMKCYILMVDSKILRLMSKNGKCVITFSRECQPKLFTEAEFEIQRQEMIANNRLVDKDVKRGLSKRMRAIENYEIGITNSSLAGKISTIDDVFKDNKLPKYKNDLVSIAEAIEKGYETNKVSVPTYKTSRRKKFSKSRRKSSVKTHEDGSIHIQM